MLVGVALGSFLGFAAACSSSSNCMSIDGGAGGAPGDAAGDVPGDAGALAPPESPAGSALAWVLRGLNGTVPTPAEVTAEFTPEFLQQVSVADVIGLLTQLSQARPWTLIELTAPTTTAHLVAVLGRGDGQYWRLAIDVDPSGRIVGTRIQPAPELDPSLDTWDEIDLALAALAPRANLLAATVDPDRCTPLHGVAADASLAIGSTFKLWVLAAVAADVATGHHQWTDMIPIQDEHKSLPSGTLQDVPAGTLLPLRTFADQMISISDNTAADHLLFLVGRPAVESMLAATGHHDPTEDQPFLGTREMSTLKLMVTPTERQAYLDAAVDDKRRLLEQYDATYDPRTYVGPDWVAPRFIDRLEWFASPADLCGVMRALRDAGGQAITAPVLDVLALNPGLEDSTGAFTYVGYKGGSEPGVLNLTWLMRRATDQQWLFFTVGWNDAAQPLDEDRAVYVAGAGRAMLARSQP